MSELADNYADMKRTPYTPDVPERNLIYRHFGTFLADEWHVIEEAEDTSETIIVTFLTEADAALFVEAVKASEAQRQESDLCALRRQPHGKEITDADVQK